MGSTIRAIGQAGLLIVALAIGGVWFWWATTPVDLPNAAPAVAPTESAATPPGSRARAERPAPPADDYVGDQACTTCHEEIAKKYAASSMAHSLCSVGDDSTLQTFSDPLAVHPGGKCAYEVRRNGERGLEHVERLLDRDGRPIYETVIPMHFSMGSGTRGRSYIANQDGILSMSSLSWYANGNRWELSPGYVPDDPRGFGRRVLDECLACHAGRVAVLDGGLGRYAANPFPQRAIGCENCHGPGGRHVAAQAAKSPIVSDVIVNPAKLATAERESVCNQCHLQGLARIPRYGRTYFDFRPGQRLEETLVVFPAGIGVAGGKTKAVSHVQQMMASKCYVGTQRELGCGSCHDPHATISSVEAPRYFRDRCLKCHAPDHCRGPLADRAARQDSCFNCHMPRLPATDVAHTAQTDHRILARPHDPIVEPTSSAPDALRVFDEGDQRLPPWEVSRATGLALVKIMLSKGESPDIAAIEALLTPPLEMAPDDTRVLNALTELALKTGNLAAAESHSRQALAADPKNEPALVALAMICYQTGNHTEGLAISERALLINPSLAVIQAQRADMLRLTDRLSEGILAAEQALRTNPRMVPVREWLAHALRDSGDISRAEEQQAMIKRLRETLSPP